MKRRNLILLGVAVFIVSLLLTAPVAVLYLRLVKTPGAVQALGLEGTLAQGRAAGVLINGQPRLHDVHWRLRPLSLLLARAAFHVDGSGDGITFDGKLARLIGGGINVDDLRIAGALKGLLALSNDAGLPLAGQAGLTLGTLKIRGGYPTLASGKLELNGLQWTLAKDPLLLGDFVADIVTEKDVLIARLQPANGPIDAGGEIRLLADHSYEIDLQVKAKPTAEPLVQNLVRSLGQPDTQGFYHLRGRGQL